MSNVEFQLWGFLTEKRVRLHPNNPIELTSWSVAESQRLQQFVRSYSKNQERLCQIPVKALCNTKKEKKN